MFSDTIDQLMGGRGGGAGVGVGLKKDGFFVRGYNYVKKGRVLVHETFHEKNLRCPP